MYQEIEQSYKKKLKMYMKLKKKRLAKMLIQCNRIIKDKPSVMYYGNDNLDKAFQKPPTYSEYIS